MILEGASRDRHFCTPLEWQQNYWPAIQNQVIPFMQMVSKTGVRGAPPPINAVSPLLNNPAGVAISLGKHGLRQEDLHIPDSKRRRSGVAGMSASPTSTADPASVPAISQTPVTAGTPTSHPMSTPAAAGKRPSTGSPVASQMPPSKVQIGTNGPIQPTEKAVDEAIAKRRAKEQAEELERQEARKEPLKYVKNAMYKVAGKKIAEQSGVAALPQPVMQGLADKVRNVGISESRTSETTSQNGLTRERSTAGQKAQLPSPPWSGTITPRQLAETFANTTDIEFALKSYYPLKDNTDDLNGFSMNDALVNGDEEEEKLVTEELSDLDFLSPLVGESGWDDAYSWTKNLLIPWNGDINTILEQSNHLGVVA